MSGLRAKTIWPTIGGVQLQIRTPPSDGVVGDHCWWPLLRAARRAELEGATPAIHLDEFELVGTRDRRRNLPVWIYLHRTTQAELYVTQEGDLFRLRASRTEIGHGRLVACTAAHALEHVGLGLRASAPILAPVEVEPPSPEAEAIERGVRFFREPTAVRHSRELRRERLLLVSDCYASGRLVRWPLGPGGHRLGADQPEDRFGRCPDHRCARCYREPAASVSADLLAALHQICSEPFPPAGGPTDPPTLGLVVDPRPGPSRPRPQPRSPFRPLLRQVWPPPAPATPPSLN